MITPQAQRAVLELWGIQVDWCVCVFVLLGEGGQGTNNFAAPPQVQRGISVAVQVKDSSMQDIACKRKASLAVQDLLAADRPSGEPVLTQQFLSGWKAVACRYKTDMDMERSLDQGGAARPSGSPFGKKRHWQMVSVLIPAK